MKCQEATEFVSALHDGETVPRDAAEHIGRCETCHARLAEYAQIGAELRCSASLNSEVEAKVGDWMNSKQVPRGWWQKGWEAMRIPRLVFALLAVAIVVLGSTLVMVKVRARDEGQVLIVTSKPSSGEPIRCALLLTNPKGRACAHIGDRWGYSLEIISADDDRIRLAIRAGNITGTKNPDGSETFYLKSLDALEEKQYWFVPGQKLEVSVPVLGNVEITGYVTDHIPSLLFDPDEKLDPAEGELRFVSPVLVRGKEVLGDLDGASTAAKRGEAVNFYAAGDALYKLSLSPLEDGVLAEVRASRVRFSVDGISYEFLLAVPVTREKYLWVLRDSSFKPPKGREGFCFLGTGPLEKKAGDQ